MTRSARTGVRCHDSYFDMYPGVWRHGDWIRITKSGSAIICGRSDTTINRHSIRIGTSELYRVLEALPEVLDSLVVDLEHLGRESWMPLFVALREGLVPDEALTKRIMQVIRDALSARHVPNDVFQVSAVRRTLSCKKMELPVKTLLMGAAADSVPKRDAMANADCLDWFVQLAQRRARASASAPRAAQDASDQPGVCQGIGPSGSAARRIGRLRQELVDNSDSHAAFADCGGHTLDRAGAHVAAGKDARHAGFQQVRIAVQRPLPGLGRRFAGAHAAPLVAHDRRRQPAGFGSACDGTAMAQWAGFPRSASGR